MNELYDPADQIISSADRVGDLLRRLRLARNLTVTELADRVGVSKGYISLVESGKRSPHWSTLMRFVHAMGETLCRFLDPTEVGVDEEELERSVCDHFGADHLILVAGNLPDEWGQVVNGDSEGFTWIMTRDRTGAPAETVRFRLPPRTPWTPEPIRYQSCATLFGLSGQLLVEIGGKEERDEYVLSPGETIRIDTSHPHRFRNFTDLPAEALLFITPAAF